MGGQIMYNPNKDGTIREYFEKKKDSFRKLHAKWERESKHRLSYKKEWNQYWKDHDIDKRI